MQTVGFVLISVGVLAALVGKFWLLFEAVLVHVAWAIGGFFFDPALVIFAVKQGGRTKWPLLLYLGGLVLLVLGATMVGPLLTW
jgi:hypothetical protein